MRSIWKGSIAFGLVNVPVMNASPAPTVSTTSIVNAGTRTVPAAHIANAPAPPIVTTTIDGPSVSHAAAIWSGVRVGSIQRRSSSLALTTSARSSSRSMRARAESASAISAGRMLGSNVSVAERW